MRDVEREEMGRGEGGEGEKFKLDITRSYLHTGFTHSDIQLIILSSPAPKQVGQAIHLQTEQETRKEGILRPFPPLVLPAKFELEVYHPLQLPDGSLPTYPPHLFPETIKVNG